MPACSLDCCHHVILTCLLSLFLSLPPSFSHLPSSFLLNPLFDRVSPEFPANNALALVIARHTCIGSKR